MKPIKRHIHELLSGFDPDMTPEMKLLLALSHFEMDETRRTEATDLLRESIDWSAFLKLCEWHGLYPLVYKALKNMLGGVGERVPAAITDTLQNKYRNNVLRMTGMSGELLRLTALLDEAGIRILPWKGLVASLQIFGDISVRTSCDIDLLVAPDDILPAVRIITGAGYKIAEYPEGLTHEQLRHIVRHIHHFPALYNPERGITVEVHWRISPLIAASALDFADMYQKSEILAWSGHSFRSLSRETAFLTMAVHGAKHMWCQLRWLCDVATLLDGTQPLDGEQIIAEAKRLDVLEIILQTVILSQLFFAIPAPAWAQEALDRNKKAAKLARMAAIFITAPPETAEAVLFKKPGRSLGVYHPLYWIAKRYDLTLCTTFSRKLLYFRYYTAPNPETFGSVSLPASLHFLYRPLRFFLWLRRRMIHGA